MSNHLFTSFQNAIKKPIAFLRSKGVRALAPGIFVLVFGTIGIKTLLDSHALTTYESTGKTVVSIAQSQLGVSEYGGAYLKYTQGRTEAWCADFASWVYWQAGIPVTGDPTKWNVPRVADLAQLAQNDNRYYKSSSSYAPMPGDLMFFRNSYKAYSHVAIVESVSGSNITNISGNSSNKVSRTTYNRYSWNVMGFAARRGYSTSFGYTTTTAGTTTIQTTTQTTAPTALMFGDINGDKYDEMIGLASNGNLSMYLNNSGGYSSGTAIGTGFQAYGRGMFSADINGDSRNDILGMDTSGNIYSYQSNGSTSAPLAASRQQVVTGVSSTNKILFGDVTGDGYDDMALGDTAGNIYLYPNGGGAFGASRLIGAGFNAQYMLGDLNADKYAELVTIEPDGNLYQYVNSRNAMSPYATKQQIGSGWGGYARVMLGDVNGDGYADIMGVTSAGDVYAYFNTRSTTTPYGSRSLFATGVALFL